MTDYLTLAEVLAMHENLITRYGGSSGRRDLGLLEAALFRLQTGYYEGIERSAACDASADGGGGQRIGASEYAGVDAHNVDGEGDGVEAVGGVDDSRACVGIAAAGGEPRGSGGYCSGGTSGHSSRVVMRFSEWLQTGPYLYQYE